MKAIMSNNTKKYIAVLALGLAVVAAVVFIFRLLSGPANIPGWQTATTTDWLTYSDPTYQFKIDYRPNLSVVREDQYIGFVDAEVEGPDHTGSSVFIEPTPFATPEEWVAQQNKDTYVQFQNREQPINLNLVPHWDIDSTITINGHTGIVAHRTSDGYPLPQVIMFIKDGNLFTVFDETADHLRTWNSFRFEE